MATKSIKFLELHYTMTQFLITNIINMVIWSKKNSNRTQDQSLACLRYNTIFNITKKLIDSDWLRAVQCKCDTSAESATTHCNNKFLDYDWLKDNRKFSKPMISHKIMTEISCRNFETNDKNHFKK